MTSAGDVNNRTSINLGHLYPHWQMVFNKYDHDGDGRLSLSEMKQNIKCDAYDGDLPPRCARRILDRADKDKDGYIDYDEFFQMIQEPEMRNILSRSLSQFVKKTIVPRRPPPTVTRSIDMTDFGEYEEEYSCNPPAVCMIIISIIEIVAFTYDVIRAGSSTVHGPAALLFIYNPHKRAEAWRYFSYMFVHVGVTHLAVNLLVQIMLGIPLEMVHRWWRVLIIYVAGVVAGSLGTSISDPAVYLAGASGGVYAIITAHVATIIMNWREMQFAVYQLLVFLVLIVSDVGTAIYHRYINDGKGDQIGYAAHFAGAIAGLLVGINILRNLEVRPWEKKVWWASIILFSALMVCAIGWNILVPQYFPCQHFNVNGTTEIKCY